MSFHSSVSLYLGAFKQLRLKLKRRSTKLAGILVSASLLAAQTGEPQSLPQSIASRSSRNQYRLQDMRVITTESHVDNVEQSRISLLTVIRCTM
jgi:hypothetical protein